jgi:hypothetical protein
MLSRIPFQTCQGGVGTPSALMNFLDLILSAPIAQAVTPLPQ